MVDLFPVPCVVFWYNVVIIIIKVWYWSTESMSGTILVLVSSVTASVPKIPKHKYRDWNIGLKVVENITNVKLIQVVKINKI